MSTATLFSSNMAAVWFSNMTTASPVRNIVTPPPLGGCMGGNYNFPPDATDSCGLGLS